MKIIVGFIRSLTYNSKISILYLISSIFSIFVWLYYYRLDKNINLLTDYPYFFLIAIHILYSFYLFNRPKLKIRNSNYYLLPEIIFSISLLFFLFFYIYEDSGRLDYIEVNVSQDYNSTIFSNFNEYKIILIIKFFPYFLSFLIFFISSRLTFNYYLNLEIFFSYKILFCIVSAILISLTTPSFLSYNSYYYIAYFCYIPLFFVFYKSNIVEILFYFIFVNIFSFTLTNFWLGTYSLLMLQGAIIITISKLLLFGLFFSLIFYFNKSGVMLIPSLLTIYDYIQTLGFFAYPWNYIGYSQYEFSYINSFASLFGIWGVNFLIYQVNMIITKLVCDKDRKNYIIDLFFMICFIVALFINIKISKEEKDIGRAEKFAITVIQPNIDPRKNNFKYDFEILKNITQRALNNSNKKPSLIVYPETSFPLNIRKWLMETDGVENEQYLKLSNEFIDFQKSTNTNLLFGNDDYFLIDDVRYDFNSAVLLSKDGFRIDTYHKMKLVPISEYFPYKNMFPKLYNFLLSYDSDFWVPGNRFTIFKSPDIEFTFFSPICFEDTFPSVVRDFKIQGGEVMINISNDYWSMKNAQAEQHFRASVFRAIENNIPVIRSSTSGVSAFILPNGKIEKRLNNYIEDYLNIEMSANHINKSKTLYFILGDKPIVIFLLLLVIFNIFSIKKVKNSAVYNSFYDRANI